jgi:hypothetical protein
MRILWLALIICLGCGTGCLGRKASRNKASYGGQAGAQKLIVTAETGFTARVVRVNPNGRFVVLTFPVGQIPTLGKPLNLYRGGLKTGEVRITGPQRDDSVIADLTAGEAQVGDEARD